MSDMLEQVARAIALAHHAKNMRAPKPEWLAEIVERDWQKFEPDARLVLAVVNKMVQQEALSDEMDALAVLDEQSDLPEIPAFLRASS
jgi:hypothetical protein